MNRNLIYDVHIDEIRFSGIQNRKNFLKHKGNKVDHQDYDQRQRTYLFFGMRRPNIEPIFFFGQEGIQ